MSDIVVLSDYNSENIILDNAQASHTANQPKPRLQYNIKKKNTEGAENNKNITSPNVANEANTKMNTGKYTNFTIFVIGL